MPYLPPQPHRTFKQSSAAGAAEEHSGPIPSIRVSTGFVSAASDKSPPVLPQLTLGPFNRNEDRPRCNVNAVGSPMVSAKSTPSGSTSLLQPAYSFFYAKENITRFQDGPAAYGQPVYQCLHGAARVRHVGTACPSIHTLCWIDTWCVCLSTGSRHTKVHV